MTDSGSTVVARTTECSAFSGRAASSSSCCCSSSKKDCCCRIPNNSQQKLHKSSSSATATGNGWTAGSALDRHLDQLQRYSGTAKRLPTQEPSEAHNVLTGIVPNNSSSGKCYSLGEREKVTAHLEILTRFMDKYKGPSSTAPALSNANVVSVPASIPLATKLPRRRSVAVQDGFSKHAREGASNFVAALQPQITINAAPTTNADVLTTSTVGYTSSPLPALADHQLPLTALQAPSEELKYSGSRELPAPHTPLARSAGANRIWDYAEAVSEIQVQRSPLPGTACKRIPAAKRRHSSDCAELRTNLDVRLRNNRAQQGRSKSADHTTMVMAALHCRELREVAEFQHPHSAHGLKHVLRSKSSLTTKPKCPDGDDKPLRGGCANNLLEIPPHVQRLYRLDKQRSLFIDNTVTYDVWPLNITSRLTSGQSLRDRLHMCYYLHSLILHAPTAVANCAGSGGGHVNCSSFNFNGVSTDITARGAAHGSAAVQSRSMIPSIKCSSTSSGSAGAEPHALSLLSGLVRPTFREAAVSAALRLLGSATCGTEYVASLSNELMHTNSKDHTGGMYAGDAVKYLEEVGGAKRRLDSTDSDSGSTQASAGDSPIRSAQNDPLTALDGIPLGLLPPTSLKLWNDKRVMLEALQSRKPLRLVSGAWSIPRADKARAGEDSYFIGDSVGYVGIADGVGEWCELGCNPRMFADEMMQGAHQAAVLLENQPSYISNKSDMTASQKALEALREGYNTTRSFGAATALVAALDPDSRTLGVANLGDSVLMILRREVRGHRNFSVCRRTKEQQHYFNCPYQLSRVPQPSDLPELKRQGMYQLVRLIDRLHNGAESSGGDSPDMTDLYDIKVQEGDLIILSTDGLLDNLFDREVTSLTSFCLSPQDAQFAELSGIPSESSAHPSGILMPHWDPTFGFATPPAALARALAEAAFYRSIDPSCKTPFSVQSRRATGHTSPGGKTDDITVIASWVL